MNHVTTDNTQVIVNMQRTIDKLQAENAKLKADAQLADSINQTLTQENEKLRGEIIKRMERENEVMAVYAKWQRSGIPPVRDVMHAMARILCEPLTNGGGDAI